MPEEKKAEGQKDYLFDTDILISLLRGKNPGLKQKVQELINKKSQVYISVISLGELYIGAFKSQNTPKNLFLINQLKEFVHIIEIDEKVIRLYGEVQSVLEKNGEKIGDFDVLIGCSAISEKLYLVSNNKKHFTKISKYFPQLNIESF